MTYRVIYTQTVIDALDAQIAYWKSELIDPDTIGSWMGRLLDSVDTLSNFPNRCSIAKLESEIKGMTIRKLVFGKYLVFFRVDEKSRTVEVLSFRHSAKLPDEDTNEFA